MKLDVDLFTVSEASIQRCITLELIDCGGSTQTVSAPVTFTAGSVTDVHVTIPCGDYTCTRARDPLHTLQRRLDRDAGLEISGEDYVASVTGPGSALVGGDFNDDNFVDILDFAIYINRFGLNYGTRDTGCTAPNYNADASGDGLVATEDFSFVLTGFLTSGDDTCCSAKPPRGNPRSSIALTELRQLRLGALAPADLTRDGVIDQADIAAYLLGQLPDGAPVRIAPTGAAGVSEGP